MQAVEEQLVAGLSAAGFHGTQHFGAAAFVRQDWLAGLRTWINAEKEKAKNAIRQRLHRKAAPPEASDLPESEPQTPSVVVGEEYAAWVRRRIKGNSRPVPTYAFDQIPVIRACDQAIRDIRRRRWAIVIVVASAVWASASGALSVGWAVLTAVVGTWAVFVTDRYVAQNQLNAMLSGPLPTGPADAQALALPYQREVRKNGPRDRFIGYAAPLP